MRAAARESERGQILVLIVLALVGMLGFTALAIDVGMIYSDRRTDQNAADAAAYAGAGALGQVIASTNPGMLDCNNFITGTTNWNNATNAAVAMGINNAFTLTAGDGDDTDGNHNEVWLTCDNGPNVMDHVDIHVRVTRKVNTSLVHLFNSGEFINTVDSTIRIAGPEGLNVGAAILALTKVCNPSDNCMTLDGSYDIKVKNGNVITNSDLMKNGHSGIINVEGGDIIYYDEFIYKAGKDPWLQVQPYPPTDTNQYTELSMDEIEVTAMLEAACSSYSGYSVDSEKDNKTGLYTGDVKAGNSTVIRPGKYNDIEVKAQNAHLKMLPGLYCINSLSVSASGKGTYALDGQSVTIFMPAGAGDFFIAGGAYSRLEAMKEDCDDDALCSSIPSGYQKPIQGLLLWSNVVPADGEITITGGSNSSFRGSIVAPHTTIDIGGNANKDDELVYSLQLIGYEIKIHGSAKIDILYDSDNMFQTDTLLSQFR